MISRGMSITNAFKETGIFTGAIIEMISAGEEAGRLEELMKKVSLYYERQVDITVRTIVSLIEPLVTLLIGLIIGMAVITLYLPIFNIGNVTRNAITSH